MNEFEYNIFHALASLNRLDAAGFAEPGCRISQHRARPSGQLISRSEPMQRLGVGQRF